LAISFFIVNKKVKLSLYRFSKGEKKAEEQANEVDWAELETAVKMTQEPLSKLKGSTSV